jgi:genome maintenance exonuclease 1
VYLVEDGSDKGEVYPSITRILAAKPKPALEAWKKRVGKREAARVSQVATVQGGNVHKLSECYLGNEPLPDYSPNVKELWRSLYPWFDEHITAVIAQEQDVYSRKLKVGGRMDLLAEVDGDLAVVDIKTAKQEKREEWVQDYFLQETFYAVAVYEITGQLPKRLILPVVSPYGLQLFESTPMQHFAELRQRIAEFYLTYEAA